MALLPPTRFRTSHILNIDQGSLFMIFDLLLPSDLKSVAGCSASLDTAVAVYLAHQLFVLLSRYVTNPTRFLGVLDTSGAVLSGSAVLALLYRTTWRPSDLDVYCPAVFFYAVVYHLAIAEGYEVANTVALDLHEAEIEYGQGGGILQGYDDERHIQNVAQVKKGDLRIDVIQSPSASPLQPIAAFWATHVQNFISLHLICVSYPTLTERGKGLLAPSQLIDMQHPSPMTLDLICKYEACDFQLAVRPYAFEEDFCSGQSSATCPASVRRFGDGHSLVLHTSMLALRRKDDTWKRVLEVGHIRWW